MIRNLFTLIIISGFSFVSFAQKAGPGAAEKFLGFLNNYAADSLRSLTSDHFQIKRTYTSYTNDKRSFIEDYIPGSKNFNATYRIIKSTRKGQTTDFLVEDQSDYFTWLGIDNPKWKIKIITDSADKVELMLIDKTANYQTFFTQNREKSEKFENWLKQKHPEETKDSIFNTSGLLLQRLKEYAGK